MSTKTDIAALKVWTEKIFRRCVGREAFFAFIGTDMISRRLEKPFDTAEAAATYGQNLLKNQVMVKKDQLSTVPMWRVLNAIREPEPSRVP